MGILWGKLLGSPAKGSNLRRVTPASSQPRNCPAHSSERRKEGRYPNAPLRKGRQGRRGVRSDLAHSPCKPPQLWWAHPQSPLQGPSHLAHAANKPRLNLGLGLGLGVQEALRVQRKQTSARQQLSFPVKLRESSHSDTSRDPET